MKRFSFFIVTVLLLNWSNVFADHVAGGYFEYSYINENSYEIRYYFLRDCDGIEVDRPRLYRRSDCGSTCTDLGKMDFVSKNFVDFGCGNTCENTSDYPGFELYIFKKVVSLPSLCDSWEFSVSISARNIVDYNNTTGSFVTYCRINNTVGNYSSPTINGAVLAVGCTENPAQALFSVQPQPTSNIICSPVESLISSQPNDPNCTYNSINYSDNFGLSFANPYPSIDYTVNSSTGQVSFVPTAPGTGYFAVSVSSYYGNTLSGEIRIEGMIVVANCLQTSPVTFGMFPNLSFQGTIPRTTGANCIQALVSGNGIPISSISHVSVPQLDVTYEQVSASLYLVTFCVNLDNEIPFFMCEDNIYTAEILVETTTTTDCLGQANGLPSSTSQSYSIFRPKAEGCAENVVVTNINSTSDMQSTSLYKAQDRIWVGDDFPAGITTVPPGPVNFTHSVTFIAGLEVVNESCLGGGDECVTFDGNVTELVIRNHCSVECIEPITICSRPKFACNNEKIEVSLSGGIPPFSVFVYVNGEFATQATGVSAFPIDLNIHPAVSSYNGNINYHIMVIDAAGQSHFSSVRPLIGTNRFYKPIQENMDIGEFGNPVYARYPLVTSEMPVLFYDNINQQPPFYGATQYTLEIYNRWGEQVLSEYKTLNQGKWSFGNGEIHWNGHQDNNLSDNCASTVDTYYPVRLTARNCYSAAVYQDCLIDMFLDPPSNWDPNYPCGGQGFWLSYVEGFFNNSNGGAILTTGQCFSQSPPWNPESFEDYYGNPVVYSPPSWFGNQYHCDEESSGLIANDDLSANTVRVSDNESYRPSHNYADLSVSLYPNPTDGLIQIQGDTDRIVEHLLLDVQSKSLYGYTFQNNSLNLFNLDAGVYFLLLTFDDGSQRTYRIVKN